MKQLSTYQLIPKRLAGVSIAIFTGLCLLASAWLTNFHIGINDFWGFFFLADQLESNWPQSLYNGLFPIGYITLLRTILNTSRSSIIPISFAVNFVFASILIYQLWNFANKHLKNNWAWLCVLIYFTSAEAFYMLHQPGPYVIFNLFCLLGLANHYAYDKQEGNWYKNLSTGLLFGLAALFRIHAFLPLACIICCDWAVHILFKQKAEKALKHTQLLTQFMWIIIGYLSIAQVQVWVNLYAGYGLFETNHGFVHDGVDWLSFSPSDTQLTLWDAVFQHPKSFFISYAYKLYQTWPWLLPSVCILVLYAFDSRIPKFWLRLSLTVCFYILIVRLHTTHRWILPLLPLCCIQIGFLSLNFWEKAKYSNLKYAGLLIIGLVVYFNIGHVRQHHYAFLKNNHTKQLQYTALEELVKGVQAAQINPMKVFSPNQGLYFPHTYPYKVYANGGWLRGIDWVHKQAAPNLDISSQQAFLESCASLSVQHIILDSKSHPKTSFFESIYQERASESWQKLGQIGELKLFKIK